MRHVLATSLALFAACGGSSGPSQPVDTDTVSSKDVGDVTEPPLDTASDGADAPDVADDVPGTVDVYVDVGPICGDATCEDGESATTCPADCPVSPRVQCLEAECGAPLAACLALESCAGIYDCLEACATGPCASGCMSGAKEGLTQVVGLLDCGLDRACFGPAPSCGNEVCDPTETAVSCPADCGGLPTECGDELCGGSETPESCSEDCGSGPACGDGECQDEETPESCAADCDVDACGDGTCARQETEESCPKDCVYKSCVGLCGNFIEGDPCQCDPQCGQFGDCCADIGPACTKPECGDTLCGEDEAVSCPEDCDTGGPVCGDGECEPEEDCTQDCAAKTCAENCGNFIPGAPCQCDGQCTGYGDCCPDYDGLCVPPATCGDGTCELLETKSECPVDCAALSPKDCLAQKCPTAPCVGQAECEPGIACLEGCVDLGCGLGCLFKVSGDYQETVAGIAGCAEAKTCFAGETVCGDTICAFGESTATCAEDCPLVVACGDGTCAQGEDCPADCTPPPSCADQCGMTVPDAPCQCGPECLGFGNCCSDYALLCLPVETCGDTICGTLETPKGCPGDCASLSGLPCIAAKCPTLACQAVEPCAVALACLAACTDATCTTACIVAGPPENAESLGALVDCARQAGCYPQPPE